MCVIDGNRARADFSRPASTLLVLASLAWAMVAPAATPGPGESFRDPLRSGGHGPEMVVVPAGQFLMGDLSGDGLSRERPVHEVTIGQSFAVGKYEVTFEDYQRFLGSSEPPGDEGWGRGNRPVINVTWTEAMAYVSWLSAQTGQSLSIAERSGMGVCGASGDNDGVQLGRRRWRKPRQLRQLRQPALGRQAIRARGLVSRPTRGACSTCTATSGNGCATVRTTTTTARHRTVRLGRPATAPSEWFVEVHFTLGQKSPGHPIASACLRTSATVFLVSEWPARWTHPNVGSFGVCFEGAFSFAPFCWPAKRFSVVPGSARC